MIANANSIRSIEARRSIDCHLPSCTIRPLNLDVTRLRNIIPAIVECTSGSIQKRIVIILAIASGPG